MKKNNQLTPERDYKIRTYDTKISEMERDLNVNLGLKKDMKLGRYLEKQGYNSLAKMLKG